VIIVDKSKIPEKCERLIPCQTVSGEGMLKAFKPDKVIISSSKNKIELTKVYVAFSEVKSKSFSAILSNELINI
jgi:stage II sporulation protein GA (sporulation sigma-E factor processing peptidase)